MSYTIKHYTGTTLTTVADGTIDTSTDLTLIGKNYAGYGQAQNDNFVWLLENFASTTQPPNPLAGQIWYDSGNNKLKFFDANGNWRTTGGSSTGTSAPTGLTQGDFWFNTTSNQLYAYTGSQFTLIGPQAVAGSGTTQMVSTSVQDSASPPATHAIIQAIDNGQTVAIISSDSAFTLNAVNPITGFSTVQQGITLAYTNNNGTPGVTTSSHRFWGTASNADKLGGFSAASFIQSGNATFGTVVNFADVGFTVGNPTAKLAIFNAGAAVPTIQNQYSDTIVFQTTVSSVTQTPLTLKGNKILPGTTATTDIGSNALAFNNVYASNFYGTAQQADKLNVNNQYWTASTASSANTIVARDSSANINANLFSGTATSANYADLAEKYLADAEYETGTVVIVGGEKEVTASSQATKAIGVVSANPAFMMNKDLEGGTYIALKGRVPVKVWGTCKKGDPMVAWKYGTAASTQTPDWNVFAVALEDSDDAGITLVECLVL